MTLVYVGYKALRAVVLVSCAVINIHGCYRLYIAMIKIEKIQCI